MKLKLWSVGLRYLLLISCLCLSTNPAWAGDGLRPEVGAYYRALIQEKDRKQLLATVFVLAGETSDTAVSLANRLLNTSESVRWAEDTIAGHLSVAGPEVSDSTLFVAYSIKAVGMGEQIDSGVSLANSDGVLFADSFAAATLWYDNLEWLLRTPLPAYGPLGRSVDLSGLVNQSMEQGQLDQVVTQIEARFENPIAHLEQLIPLILIHLKQTGNFKYIGSLWQKSVAVTGASETDKLHMSLLRSCAFRLALHCTADNEDAKAWGLERVREIYTVLKRPRIEGSSKEVETALSDFQSFVLPFSRIHPSEELIQNIANDSLNPSSPLFRFRPQLIPIFASFPSGQLATDAVRYRINLLEITRGDSLRVMRAVESTIPKLIGDKGHQTTSAIAIQH